MILTCVGNNYADGVTTIKPSLGFQIIEPVRFINPTYCLHMEPQPITPKRLEFPVGNYNVQLVLDGKKADIGCAIDKLIKHSMLTSPASWPFWSLKRFWRGRCRSGCVLVHPLNWFYLTIEWPLL